MALQGRANLFACRTYCIRIYVKYLKIQKVLTKLHHLEGDDTVEVEESTTYEDWLCDQGLSMNSTKTTEFHVKVKVDDITDNKNENKNSGDEGPSKKTEENSEVQKCDGKITDSTKEDTKVKQDIVTEVKTLDSIKFKVKDLINKGETAENSEIMLYIIFLIYVSANHSVIVL